MKKVTFFAFFCWISIHAMENDIAIDLLNTVNFSDISEITESKISETTLQEMLDFQEIIKNNLKRSFILQTNNSQIQDGKKSWVTYCSKCGKYIKSKKDITRLHNNISYHIATAGHRKMKPKEKELLKKKLIKRIQYFP